MKNLLLVGAVGFVGLAGVGVGAWYYTGSDQRAKAQAEARILMQKTAGAVAKDSEAMRDLGLL